MRKVCILVSIFSLMALFVGSSAVAAPIDGIYLSQDITGGQAGFLTGRWSEGFVLNDPNHVGNGAHAASWNGANLASQWELSGPTLSTSTLLFSNLVNGTGTQVYERVFNTSGATVTLQPTAWWSGSGDGTYTVNLDSYSQNVTIMYRKNQPLFANSVESFHGMFANFTNYTLTGQASGVLVNVGAGQPPAGFPSWIPGSAMSGSWGDTGFIQLAIAPEPATMILLALGAVATAAAHRRRKRNLR